MAEQSAASGDERASTSDTKLPDLLMTEIVRYVVGVEVDANQVPVIASSEANSPQRVSNRVAFMIGFLDQLSARFGTETLSDYVPDDETTDQTYSYSTLTPSKRTRLTSPLGSVASHRLSNPSASYQASHPGPHHSQTPVDGQGSHHSQTPVGGQGSGPVSPTASHQGPLMVESGGPATMEAPKTPKRRNPKFLTGPVELVPLSPLKGKQTFQTLLREAETKFSHEEKAAQIIEWYGEIFMPKNITAIKKKILATLNAPSAYAPAPPGLPATIAAVATDVRKLLSWEGAEEFLQFYQLMAYADLHAHWTDLCNRSITKSSPESVYMRAVALEHGLTTKERGDSLVSAFMVWTLHGCSPVTDAAQFKSLRDTITYHHTVGRVTHYIRGTWGKEMLLLLPKGSIRIFHNVISRRMKLMQEISGHLIKAKDYWQVQKVAHAHVLPAILQGCTPLIRLTEPNRSEDLEEDLATLFAQRKPVGDFPLGPDAVAEDEGPVNREETERTDDDEGDGDDEELDPDYVHQSDDDEEEMEEVEMEEEGGTATMSVASDEMDVEADLNEMEDLSL